ncbi:MAG: hypothetical protein IPM26_16655 [Saprospiraceae bacterium]|nr:hypothetical protein [Saprospiraceae bacterium]
MGQRVSQRARGSVSTEAGITTIVSLSEIVNSNDKGTTPEHLVDKFGMMKAPIAATPVRARN